MQQLNPAPEIHALPPEAMGALVIDTQAIVDNYRTLKGLLPHTTCAAVLKANAYGFGLTQIAPLLEDQGCQHFFVAHIEEGLQLRKVLPQATIYVLSGLLPQTADLFVEHSLTPVLNDFHSLSEWTALALKIQKKLPAVLHIDTGMKRNGFDGQDLASLLEKPEMLDALQIPYMMSHLACSNDPSHPANAQQREAFEAIRKQLPSMRASLADTGGIYLGSSYHYDLARPGKGLFGLFKPPSSESPLKPCLTLLGRILQVRHAQKGETVGYGTTHTLSRPSRLATIAIGFADGYNRRLSNTAFVEIAGFKAPVVGMISMDYTVIDVTDVPEALCHRGGWVELANERTSLDALASLVGTISRELSSCFSPRLHRVFV